MNTPKVYYFDGVSSAKHEATLKLLISEIEITYYSDLNFRTVKWYQNDIHIPNLTTGEKIVLRYGKNFPYQSIELKNDSFTKDLLTTYNLNTKAKKYSVFTENGYKGVFLGIVAFIATFILFYKVILPSIAETAAVTIPIEYEQSFGKTIKETLIANNEIDSVKTKSLQKFYNKLNYKSDYTIDLTVVNSPVQNAFATPGGNIVVFSGIIDHMECPEELAALLGHELTHVNKRHSTKSIFRSLANVIVLSVLLNDVNGITTLIIDNANSIQELSFSRSLEKEADTEAVSLMFENNIDPEGMLGLLEQLDTLNHGLDIPEFLTTHPVTKNRISYVKELIAEKQKQKFNYPDWNNEWNVLKKQNIYNNEDLLEIDVFDIFKDDKNTKEEKS